MYLRKAFGLFLFAIFASIQAAFIDTLNKCSVKDNECQQKLYTDSIREIARTGLSEYGIPPFDPYVIKNISVPVLGLVDIGIVDGVAKGARNCVFTRVNTTIENLHATQEIVCDITIKGRYKVSADNPIVKNLLGGGTVRGDGYAEVKIKRFRVLFDFDIFLREADGEIYIDCKYEDTNYKYDFGKINVAADNLYIGEVDVSQQMVALVNDNWRFIVSTFSKPFVDTAMDIVYDFTHKFFDVTPARFYLLEDLKEYYKN